ncbi:putative nitroreductase [Vermiconidia calcicola]|uniref:Nitroreductase n=1 Tax=Vermiconidia calcicola TaxID=1690605 RepID=A0ACC3MIN2_9PEZI|nr:putative nitroreductase [Vermiconidia calcicola]
MSQPIKATETPLFTAAEDRISCYQLADTSPVPDSRIHEIVNFAVKHTPSSFNVQSARAVILLKNEHKALWDLADEVAKATVPEAHEKMLAKMIQGFRAAYGTILLLEDQDSLESLRAKYALFGHLVPEWSEASSGMHQYLIWKALQLEGLGCNLQHFNFMPEFTDAVRERWDLPKTWELKSQLVFGAPSDGQMVRKRERTYLPLEERPISFRQARV